MQVGSGGAGIWTRATCLHKHGLSLPLMSWALGVNVPTAFKLTSHHMACSKAFTLPKSTLACGYCLHTVLSLCWLVSSIHALSSHPETLSWGIIRTAPPWPSPMVHQCPCHVSSTFTWALLPGPHAQVQFQAFSYLSQLNPVSPGFQYDPFQKHSTSTWPLIFLWKYRSHLIMFLL